MTGGPQEVVGKKGRGLGWGDGDTFLSLPVCIILTFETTFMFYVFRKISSVNSNAGGKLK